MPSRNPSPSEIADYLASRSSAEMTQLFQAIKSHHTRTAFAKELFSYSPTGTEKGATPEKVKKALNAFVGFRCYYILIPSLKQFPMKKLSGIMSQLWEADPNKSIWALMTKAWSSIRDQIGKDNAPLEQFFRIVCPSVDIPSPEDYFATHGYQLNVDSEGILVLLRPGNDPALPLRAAVTDIALSVEDIINCCKTHGYAQNLDIDAENIPSTFLGFSNPKQSVQLSFVSARDAAKQKRRAADRTRRLVAPAARKLRMDINKAYTNCEDYEVGEGEVDEQTMHHTLAYLQTGSFMTHVNNFLAGMSNAGGSSSSMSNSAMPTSAVASSALPATAVASNAMATTAVASNAMATTAVALNAMPATAATSISSALPVVPATLNAMPSTVVTSNNSAMFSTAATSNAMSSAAATSGNSATSSSDATSVNSTLSASDVAPDNSTMVSDDVDLDNSFNTDTSVADYLNNNGIDDLAALDHTGTFTMNGSANSLVNDDADIFADINDTDTFANFDGTDMFTDLGGADAFSMGNIDGANAFSMGNVDGADAFLMGNFDGADTASIDDFDIAAWVANLSSGSDDGAFRPGANQDTTLPSFDGFNN